ncbi:hypothetical protein Ahy_A05g023408 isoform B [Arachis hypogaea]|uniref:Uncharacterized protein n=1 Tax=Arachis hypogaea TaxID=3818 RepID=A0A445D3U3_ARAHY|nr:hypothetical protein Ahy_A05g023408 isoform B [Arachis hypogaea]
MKRTSLTALKIVLRSVREGRNETLSDYLKKEFRLTMNILRSTISEDMYEFMKIVGISDGEAGYRTSSGAMDVIEHVLEFVTDSLDQFGKLAEVVIVAIFVGAMSISVLQSVWQMFWLREY